MTLILSIVTLVIVPVAVSMSFAIVKKSQKYFVGRQKSLAELNSHVEEMISNILQQTAAASARITDFLIEEEEADSPFDKDPEQIQGNIVFEDVMFGYEPDNPVIKNFLCHLSKRKHDCHYRTDRRGKNNPRQALVALL